jgi:hypothetical protein
MMNRMMRRIGVTIVVMHGWVLGLRIGGERA